MSGERLTKRVYEIEVRDRRDKGRPRWRYIDRVKKPATKS